MMGKGTIVSHTGEGLYSVTLNLDKTHLTAELTKLATDITNYGIAIPEITTQIATLEAELAALDPSSTEYKNKKKTYDAKVKIKNVFIINLAAAIKRQSFLNKNMPVDPTISAWCADLTTDLSGSVGTIEVPGERHTIVNIQPGFNNNAVYSQTRDGKLQPSLAGLENAVFYNYAILPGWQKWMPTYRYGTITAVSGDNCDVTLEAAVSSVTDKNGNGLDVNAVTTLSNVPIDYMDCDGEAFEVDDVVLIKFNSVEADIKNAGNWAHATVIGFKDHPKAPGGAVIYVQVYDLDWNIAGYVGLDSTLELMDTLETSISFPVPNVMLIDNNSIITRFVDTWGTPYLTGTIPGAPEPWQKTWLFAVNTAEHETRVETLSADGNTLKECSVLVTNTDLIRRGSVITSIDDPEPPPPSLNDTGFPPGVFGISGTYNGTVPGMYSENAGWIDINHYIYMREDHVYTDCAYNEYIAKTYLIINGDETFLYQNDNKIDDGYFYNYDGYILLSDDDYSEGAAIFEVGENYIYVATVCFYRYGAIPFVEFFHYDGATATLTRKTYDLLEDSGSAFNAGTFDGVDYMSAGDITIG
jgi:hypothetical protein